MVMYRDFAARKARSLALAGIVKNMDDGTVVVVAEGEESALIRFTEQLRSGPILAHVEDITVLWAEATGEFTDFHISYV
jgi:acylphosphatase